ncbi:glycosyltransferase family 9 protein [candidate division WOR-3 bacterium]|nr:glycosyltransferase family 9 protein [candidate division WOR-3 bacterium]
MADSATRESTEKIIFSIWPGLGDILFSTPSLRILRKKKPEARITVISLWGGAGRKLLELNPYIDDVIFSGPKEIFQLAKRLKRENFDLGIEQSFPVCWFFKLINVKKSVSFADNLFWWLGHFSDKKNALLHASEQYLLAIDKIDGKKLRDGKGYDLFLSEDEKNRAKEILKDFEGKIKIAVHPGARCNKNKRWDINKIIDVLHRIAEMYDCVIITIGGAEDKKNASLIESALKHKNVNLVGKTNLRETAAVFSESDLYLGHDSGPTHLASIFSPVVAIFASSNPANFRPLTEKAVIVRPKTRCSPCFHFPGYMSIFWGLRLRWFNYCPAMDTIGVEDVVTAIKEALEKWPKNSR